MVDHVHHLLRSKICLRKKLFQIFSEAICFQNKCLQDKYMLFCDGWLFLQFMRASGFLEWLLRVSNVFYLGQKLSFPFFFTSLSVTFQIGPWEDASLCSCLSVSKLISICSNHYPWPDILSHVTSNHISEISVTPQSHSLTDLVKSTIDNYFKLPGYELQRHR